MSAKQTSEINWAKVQPGATVVRYGVGTRHWTITEMTSDKFYCRITIQHGRRERRLTMPICILGPCLADVGLSPGNRAPSQQTMFSGTKR